MSAGKAAKYRRSLRQHLSHLTDLYSELDALADMFEADLSSDAESRLAAVEQKASELDRCLRSLISFIAQERGIDLGEEA